MLLRAIKNQPSSIVIVIEKPHKKTSFSVFAFPASAAQIKAAKKERREQAEKDKASEDARKAVIAVERKKREKAKRQQKKHSAE